MKNNAPSGELLDENIDEPIEEDITDHKIFEVIVDCLDRFETDIVIRDGNGAIMHVFRFSTN